MNLRPPIWYKSTGTAQDAGEVLAIGTYYAEIPKGKAKGFGFTLVYDDGTLVATATVEGNDVPGSVAAATTFAAAGVSGWEDESPIADIVIVAGAGSQGKHVVEFEKSRARIKLVVTTAGTCTLYPTVGAN